jgi:hypothetical protein
MRTSRTSPNAPRPITQIDSNVLPVSRTRRLLLGQQRQLLALLRAGQAEPRHALDQSAQALLALVVRAEQILIVLIDHQHGAVCKLARLLRRLLLAHAESAPLMPQRTGLAQSEARQLIGNIIIVVIVIMVFVMVVVVVVEVLLNITVN